MSDPPARRHPRGDRSAWFNLIAPKRTPGFSRLRPARQNTRCTWTSGDGKRVLVCTVGTTTLFYDARCIDDLYTMLQAAGDWVELGGADEQKPAKEGTVEAWGRSPDNPVGGWYWLEEGAPRSIRGVYPAAHGGAGSVRARAQHKGQSHARQISGPGANGDCTAADPHATGLLNGPPLSDRPRHHLSRQRDEVVQIELAHRAPTCRALRDLGAELLV